MDEFVLNIGKVFVKFSGKSEVFDSIRKEFSLYPLVDADPNLEFNFLNKSPVVEEDLVRSNNLLVSSNKVYVNDGHFFYVISECSKKWKVDLYCFFKFPASYYRKIIYSCKRFFHWNYLYHHENLAKNFIYNIFDYIFELFSLKKNLNQTFIHASSFDKNGQGILLAALGGVGKTTLMTKLVFEHNCKFLADDLSIIDDRYIYFNPKFLQIYPYNLLNNPYLSKVLFRNRSLIDKVNWYLRSRLKGLKGVRRRMSPFDVFGSSNICYKSRFTKIFFMRYANASKISISNVSCDYIAELCSNVIVSELFPLANILLNIYSSIQSCFIPSLAEFLDKVKKVYCSVFANKKCFLIDLPERYDLNYLCDLILETI